MGLGNGWWAEVNHELAGTDPDIQAHGDGVMPRRRDRAAWYSRLYIR